MSIALRRCLRDSGFQASIATTYSLLPPFYEDVLLRHMLAAGCRYNILLADAGRLSEEMAHSSTRPRSAGSSYALLPIRVGGAFHPKIILQVGRRRGRLIVGSHNLTLAGFSDNRELTVIIDVVDPEKDNYGREMIASAWRYCQGLIIENSARLPPVAPKLLEQVFYPAPWLRSTVEEGGPEPEERDGFFLATSRNGSNLFDQLLNRVPQTPRQAVMTAPFLDAKLAFPRELKERGARVTLVCDDSCDLPEAAASADDLSFVPADGLGDSAGPLHAKALFLSGADGKATLAIGSANPSAPAWLADGGARNAEAIFVLTGDRAKLEAERLGLMDLATHEPMSPAARENLVRLAKERRGRDRSGDPGTKVWIAIREPTGFRLFGPGVSGAKVKHAEILDAKEVHLSQATKIAMSENSILVDVAADAASAGAFVRVVLEDPPHDIVLAIVLREQQLMRQALSNEAQRMREAFISLDLGRGDFDQVFTIVEKVVNAAAGEAAMRFKSVQPSGPSDSKVIEPDEERELPPTLAIPTALAAKRRRTDRVVNEGDFAELLNLLIYTLGVRESEKGIDAEGRNEEEQVGADDEEEEGNGEPPRDQHVEAIEPEEFLRRAERCRARCKTLIRRISQRLQRAVKGEDDLVETMIRLLASLSLLRRLRGLDSRSFRQRNANEIRRIEGGLPRFVPSEQLEALWVAATKALFDPRRPLGIQALETKGLRDSDEFARLSGLLIWLAYEVGADIDEPLDQGHEDSDGQLRKRASLVMILSMAGGTDVALEEAAVSIAQSEQGGEEWLVRHGLVSKQLGHLIADDRSPPTRESMPQVGDFVYLRKKPIRFWRVGKKGPSKITLLPPADDAPASVYLASMVRAVDLSDLFSGPQTQKRVGHPKTALPASRTY